MIDPMCFFHTGTVIYTNGKFFLLSLLPTFSEGRTLESY